MSGLNTLTTEELRNMIVLLGRETSQLSEDVAILRIMLREIYNALGLDEAVNEHAVYHALERIKELRKGEKGDGED